VKAGDFTRDISSNSRKFRTFSAGPHGKRLRHQQ
jgi:hypothetical protein